MEWEALGVSGAWLFTPKKHRDDRGWFIESFKQETFEEATGHPFRVAQTNVSHSRAGVIRGIHFSQFPTSQGKYVTCLAGSILDVVVDVRAGSPTFGKWEAVRLDSREPRALYISEGLGHAFMALEDDSTVTYMVSSGYAPGREHGVDPLDPSIGIEWPVAGPDGTGLVPILSAKDLAAPKLPEAFEEGILPDYTEALEFAAALRRS